MKKKLRKGAWFSDIHFGRKSNSKTHNEDCLNYLRWFCNRVKANQCEFVGFLGDWNEHRNSLNIETLDYAYRGAKMLNDLGIPVYFVVGNHDLYYRDSRDLYSVVYHNEFDNFIIIDQPTVVEEIKGNVLFCPYLFHKEYPSLLEYRKIPVWAGHFEFKGYVLTGETTIMKSGPDAKDFKGPKHIFSGHFHKRQSKPKSNVTYIGNAFPMDFSDAGDNNRGCMIYNHETDECSFENWDDCPKYVRTKLTDMLDEDVQKEILLSGARVQCVVDEPITYEDSMEIRESIGEQFNLRELVLQESPEIKEALTDTELNDTLGDELSTVDELVLIMLDRIETDHIDNELLKTLYRRLEI